MKGTSYERLIAGVFLFLATSGCSDENAIGQNNAGTGSPLPTGGMYVPAAGAPAPSGTGGTYVPTAGAPQPSAGAPAEAGTGGVIAGAGGSIPVEAGAGGGGGAVAGSGGAPVADASLDAGLDPDGGIPDASILPPVTSVEAEGPFATSIEQNVGPGNGSWVFYPTELGKDGLLHPVFGWGPGAMTGPAEYEEHLRKIASHGFVVISQVSTNTGSEMTAALDWILAENERAGSIYYQKLDTSRVAAGGHSRGSISTFAMASDPRLSTTIHVAGGSFDGLGSNNLRNPAAYILGEADTLATPNGERDYEATTVPVFLTVMTGVDHMMATREGLPAIIAWLRWHLGGESFRQGDFLDPGCYFCTGKWVSKNKNW